MADYFSPTVVQTTIPLSDMTALERLLLTQMFQSEPEGDDLYFYASDAVSEQLFLAVAELRAALAASADVESRASRFVGLELADETSDDIELDLTDLSWTGIFQDIVRRSPTLAHVVITSAFTCTRMRPDGFGGMVVLITADEVFSRTTDDMLCEMLDQAEYGELGAAPGHGVHVLLRLAEADVRAALADVIETDARTSPVADEVSDVHVRAGCRRVVENTDLTEERGRAIYNAALASIAVAGGR